MHSDCCVICLSHSVVEYASSGRSNNVAVEREAQVIFILRNLFEVPREKLQNYLLGNGSPSLWGIRLCSRCSGFVQQLKGIYGEMMKLKRKFNATKERILKVAKATDDSVERGGVIFHETRAFMRDRKYLNPSRSTDPSIAGDSLACKLLFEKGYISHPIQTPTQSSNLEGVINERINTSNYTNGLNLYFSEVYLSKPQVPFSNEVTNRFKCSQCGKDLSSRNKLRFHAITTHPHKLFENEKLPGISEKRFHGICNFFLKNGLAANGATSQNAVHFCSRCGASFSDRRYLQNHWVQVHYTEFAQRLRNHQAQILKNLPPVPSLNSLPNVEETPSTSCSSSGSGTTEKFKCTHCTEIFFNPEKLKEHAVLHHPEQFFPPSQFNLSGVLLETFQASCQLLFRGEDIKRNGEFSFSCPLCLKSYLSRDTVLVHLVETHYDHMVLKLLKIVKQSAKVPRVTSSAAAEAETQTQRLLDSILEPELNNSPAITTAITEVPTTSTSTNYSFHEPFRRPFVVPRGKRSDMKQPPRLKCDACGTMFSTAPCLSRHKNYHCHIRRLHGLLKDKPIVPRLYVPRRNPPLGTGRRGGAASRGRFMGIPNLPQYYPPRVNHPHAPPNFSTMPQFPPGFASFHNATNNYNNYEWQESSSAVNPYNEQLVSTPQQQLEVPIKTDVKCKMDSDEILFLEECDARIVEEQFVGSDNGLIVPDEDPLAM